MSDNMKYEAGKIIEAIIFASGEEITVKQIKEILNNFEIKITPGQIEDCINELNQRYTENSQSFKIIKIAGGYQYSTREEYAPYIGKMFTEKQKKKLSPSALETLAITAYKQPITRSEIEFIRGVNVDYIVNSLIERELIHIIGRADTPGRPILYGTTKNFLKTLGIDSLGDLPKLKEINEILKNEKIEGITEADIDLFNSFANPLEEGAKDTEQTSLYDTDEKVKVQETDGDEDERTGDGAVEDIENDDDTGEEENNEVMNIYTIDNRDDTNNDMEDREGNNAEDVPDNGDNENENKF